MLIQLYGHLIGAVIIFILYFNQLGSLNTQHRCIVTFVPHGSDVVEPLFNSCDSVWRVFVSPAGYFGYSGHRAFECTAGFGHHGVVTEMEIQCLHNVGRIIVGAWVEQKANVSY